MQSQPWLLTRLRLAALQHEHQRVQPALQSIDGVGRIGGLVGLVGVRFVQVVHLHWVLGHVVELMFVFVAPNRVVEIMVGAGDAEGLVSGVLSSWDDFVFVRTGGTPVFDSDLMERLLVEVGIDDRHRGTVKIRRNLSAGNVQDCGGDVCVTGCEANFCVRLDAWAANYHRDVDVFFERKVLPWD